MAQNLGGTTLKDLSKGLVFSPVNFTFSVPLCAMLAARSKHALQTFNPLLISGLRISPKLSDLVQFEKLTPFLPHQLIPFR